MSALGNTIEDDDTEGAASLLSGAIEAEDKPVTTEDVAALAAELAAAKKDVAAERQQRIAATDTAARNQTAFQSEQERRFQAAESAMANGAIAAQSEVERLVAEASKAFEAQDWTKGAELSAEAGEARMRLAGFKASKDQVVAERERSKTQTAGPEDGLTSATRAWINDHPRFRTDPVYQQWALTAHQEATTRKGFAADSKQYFDYVNQRVAQFEGPDDEPVTTTTQTKTPGEIAAETSTTRSGATTAAPVSRRQTGNAGGDTQRGGTVKLTADQRDAANRMFADRFNTEPERLQHYIKMQERVKESGRYENL